MRKANIVQVAPHVLELEACYDDSEACYLCNLANELPAGHSAGCQRALANSRGPSEGLRARTPRRRLREQVTSALSHFTGGDQRTYRPQLGHVPAEILCGVHHLRNNPVHFLSAHKLKKTKEKGSHWRGRCEGKNKQTREQVTRMVQPEAHLAEFAVGPNDQTMLRNLQSCRGLRCRLCRRA